MNTKTYDVTDDILIYHSCTSKAQESAFKALEKSCKISMDDAQKRYAEILNGDKDYLRSIEGFLSETAHGLVLQFLDMIISAADEISKDEQDE